MKNAVDAHADATHLDVHDLVRILVENAGATVVQAMTSTKDKGQVHRWARPNGPQPRLETEQQLRLGYRVWRMIEQSDGRHVALAWLVGANPRLDEDTPVTAVREGRAREVVGAAQAFVDGSPTA